MKNSVPVWRKILPHAVALLVFAAVSMLFFAPQYQNKALRQDDMLHASGMSQDIREHIEQYGEHPQWVGRMFGGMPAYTVNMNYEGRWVKSVADLFYFLGQPAAFLFIAMAGFYLMLLLMGVNPWIAMIGGLGYGLSAYFPIIIKAGHITKMIAMAWVAPMIGGIWYAYRKNIWLGAAITGIFASIEISASHPQITYYFFFVIIALTINELARSWREKTLKKFGITSLALLVAGLLAVGSNLVQLYYIQDHTPETTRGRSELTNDAADPGNRTAGLDRDYVTGWSYGKAETFNLFIPNFMGGSSSGGFSDDGEVAGSLDKYQRRDLATQLPGYWGDQPLTDGPVYLGAVMVFLFVFALFYLPGRKKWWIVGVMALAAMLAWGRHFMWLTDLFLDYVPLYNKFRTVSMLLVIVQWGVPLLGMLALQQAWAAGRDKAKFDKSFKYSVAITGGVALLAALFGPMVMDFSSPVDTRMGLPEDVIAAMQDERASMLRSDAFRSLAFVLLAAAALWLGHNRKIKASWVVAGLALLAVADLFNVDRRYVRIDDFMAKRRALAIEMSEADKQILQDKSNYRVLNLTTDWFQDATTSYFHRSVGGYSAAKLQRYQDVMTRHMGKGFNMAVLNMLNAKYFIVPVKDGAPAVQMNPGALGDAWFVDKIEWAANADQEIAALDEPFDPAMTAVVDERFRPDVQPPAQAADSSAYLELTDYKVNRLTYRSSNPQPGVAVFSEIYYPKGWTAYIDGEQAPYYRADYILRAMNVPSGEHTIEWRFAAPYFTGVTAVTKASSLILLLGAAAMTAISAIQKRKEEDEQ